MISLSLSTKVLWKLHAPEFPLRLLPSYRAAQDGAAEQLLAFLRRHFLHWAPAPAG